MTSIIVLKISNQKYNLVVYDINILKETNENIFKTLYIFLNEIVKQYLTIHFVIPLFIYTNHRKVNFHFEIPKETVI